MPVKKTSHPVTGGAGGGGMGSRSTAKVTTYHAGYNASKISPGGVAQFGSSARPHAQFESLTQSPRACFSR